MYRMVGVLVACNTRTYAITPAWLFKRERECSASMHANVENRGLSALFGGGIALLCHQAVGCLQPCRPKEHKHQCDMPPRCDTPAVRAHRPTCPRWQHALISSVQPCPTRQLVWTSADISSSHGMARLQGRGPANNNPTSQSSACATPDQDSLA